MTVECSTDWRLELAELKKAAAASDAASDRAKELPCEEEEPWNAMEGPSTSNHQVFVGGDVDLQCRPSAARRCGTDPKKWPRLHHLETMGS